MNIEQQVTSLDISKRLKELGVKQESVFFWHIFQPEKEKEIAILSHANKIGDIHLSEWNNEASAFTVAELGEILPAYLPGKVDFLYTWKDDAGWWRVDYTQWGMQKATGYLVDKYPTEADARGAMLIYLIENNLLILKKIT